MVLEPDKRVNGKVNGLVSRYRWMDVYMYGCMDG
jgi:hypothetical protein